MDSVGFGTCFGEGTPLLKLSANALGVVVWVQKEVRFPGGPDSLWRSQVCSVVAAQQPHGKLLPSLLQARVAYFTVVQLLGTWQSRSVACTQPKPLGAGHTGNYKSPIMHENLPCSPGCSHSGSLGVVGPM